MARRSSSFLPVLAAERAKDYLEDVRIQNLKRLSYVDDGVVLGEFHERNDGSAIRNPSFKPFKSPVPFMLIRRGVASDWMFFLDDEDWFGFWARRFGESALRALAGELRHINWRRLGTLSLQITTNDPVVHHAHGTAPCLI